jgi:hypothetical protein
MKSPTPKVLLAGTDYARINLDQNTKARIESMIRLINASPMHVPVSRSSIVRMAIARFVVELQAELKKLATLPELEAHRLESRLRSECLSANKAGEGVRRVR